MIPEGFSTCRKMYWTEQDDNLGIVSGGMDGMGNYLMKKNFRHPTSIAIDFIKIFWLDRSSEGIKYSGMNGLKRQVFISSNGSRYVPQNIVTHRGWLYWAGFDANAGLGAIARVNFGSDKIELYETLRGNSMVEQLVDVGNLTDPIRSMHVFDVNRNMNEGRQNPCVSLNQSCAGVCVLSGQESFRCLCPTWLTMTRMAKPYEPFCLFVFQISAEFSHFNFKF